MLTEARFLATQDVRSMMRAKETLVWVFVMPVVFFFFIGTVTGGFGPSASRPPRLSLEEEGEAGFLADQVERRLADRGFEVLRGAGAQAPGAADGTGEGTSAPPSRRVLLPERFSEEVLAGHPTSVRFLRRGGTLGGDYDDLRVGRAVYTVLADVVVSGVSGATPDREALERLNATPRALALDVRPAGVRRRVPSGFEQAIPGTLVMFTLLVMTTSGAVLLVIERRQGLLRRLASTPISRGNIVLGKWGGRMVLGLVQIGFAMLAGTLFFRMDWGPNLAAVMGVLVAYGAMMASLGLLLGCLARSEGQAVAIGVVASNVLAALGGCWWPIEITPDWMQRLALVLPTGWAMDALHRLVSFGSAPAAVLPHVLALCAGALLLGWLAARQFRFQ